MATFTGTAGANTFIGAAGVPDLFLFQAGHLSGSDTLLGGAGAVVDTLRLTTAGTIAAASFANVSGIEQVQLANGTNALVVTNGLASSANGAVLTIVGTMGNDFVQAGGLTASAIDVTGSGGNDTVIGGLGADTFRFSATALTAADRVTGGGGSAVDQLVVTSPGTVVLTGVVGIEKLVLTNGANSLSLTNSLVGSANGDALTVVGAVGNDVINGGALTGVNRLDVTAGLGADTLTGGAGADLFRFQGGGLTATDTVVGGAGVDQVVFTGAGSIGSGLFANVSGIDQITLANGANNLILSNAQVGASDADTLTIRGGSGNDVVNGGAVLAANTLDITGMAGNDTLIGGAGADLFRVTTTSLTSADTINGGAGLDRLLFQNVGTISSAMLSNVRGVDLILLSNGSNNLTLNNAMVGASDNDVVSVLGGTGNDVVNGAGLTAPNRLDVSANVGADTLAGGAGADTFRFTAAALAATDTVVGNAGADTLVFTTAGTIGSAALANVRGVDVIVLAGGSTRLTLNNAMVGASDGDVVTIDGSAGGNDVVDASALAGANRVTILGGSGADTLTGGAGDDLLDGNAFDIVNGGGGNDRILTDPANQFANLSTFLGGSGNDAIEYNFASPGNPDVVIDGGGDSDTLFYLLNDALVIDLGIVNADQTTGDTADVRNFENVDWSGAPSVLIATGPDNQSVNTILGGSGNDTINGNGGADFINGNGGNDTLMNNSPVQFATGATFLGGAGDDRIEYNVASGTEGIPLLDGGGDSDTLVNVFVDTVFIDLSNLGDQSAVDQVGTDDFSDVRNFENVDWSASSGALTVFGNAQANTLLGGSATDSLFGFGGDDFLAGAMGGAAVLAGDRVDGGNGNDRVQYNDSSGTVATLAGGADTDTLFVADGATASVGFNLAVGGDQSSADTTVVTGFENIDFAAGSGNVTATGSTGANTLIGGSGNDTLDGAGGVDTLAGGSGADTLVLSFISADSSLSGGAGADTFRYTATQYLVGAQTRITDFSHADDTLSFSTAFFPTNPASGGFVVVAQPSGSNVDISLADLVVLDDSFIATKDAVLSYLDQNTTTANQPVFVVGRVGGAGADVHLYYTQNAGNAAVPLIDLANLGPGFDPATLDASDFVFA
ncbi:beta strand repeat-containing protein [Zavarzinia sp. CC-PAN008]|uniref:beta strand repeat-containing protein n=1 Tax=Zavarzinia sp. CC-PAN008 TaxID=3243332 RepID=UPI003F748768